tara:strand:- start:240 stop:734 length:495 start_codon:yes stop_codon:yes gene_type:complete
MKIIAILISVLFFGCQPSVSQCDSVSFRGFTHYESTLLIIYKTPNGDTLKEVSPDEEAGWIAEIKELQGNYFKIDIADLEIKEAWVLKESIYVNTRNYDGQIISLYESFDKSSKPVGYLQKEQTVRVLDACGKWVYVEGIGKDGKIKGWLEPEMQCGNPYTTCP